MTSRYKSQFLANMSHELRTPLEQPAHLVEVAGRQLATAILPTSSVNLPARFTAAGTDLLSLINDILDLSKIESGTVCLELGDVTLGE